MLVSLIRYIRGYLRIRIIGYSPERFLNLCSHHQIYLWGLESCGHDYEMYISVRGFRKLKPIIKKTKTRVVIQKRYGLPFFLHKYRKRKIFFAGAIGCVFFIYLMSFFVWNIHIEGNYTRTDETILEYLETTKVRHGMPKSEIHCARIVKDLRKHFDDIIWASASIEGTRLMIQVKENTDTVKEQEVHREEKITDLAASTSGEVVKIITRAGEPVVEVGDKVEKGDVLVRGRIEIKNDAKEVVEYRYQNADADVYIKTREDYEKSVPISYEKKVYTGKKRRLGLLKTGRYVWQFGVEKNRYSHADTFTQERQLQLGEHFYFPVFYGTKTVREYRFQKEKRKPKEFQEILSKDFQVFCRNLGKKGVEIVEKDVKIYNDNQSARASGSLTLIRKAEDRKDTEIIQIKEKKEIPEGVN